MKKTLGRLGSVAAAVGLVDCGARGSSHGPAQAGEIDANDSSAWWIVMRRRHLRLSATTNNVESCVPGENATSEGVAKSPSRVAGADRPSAGTGPRRWSKWAQRISLGCYPMSTV